MLDDNAQTQLLDAAENLFYANGIQAVGMDDVRAASGLSLKKLYGLYPSKDRLVEAFLERRDLRWRGSLANHVDRQSDPIERILAVFDWMRLWFEEPGFRGCAWINAYGELGASSPAVARLAREHKRAFRDYLAVLVREADLPDPTTDHLVLLAEGAMAIGGILRTPEPALQAHVAARGVIAGGRRASRSSPPVRSRATRTDPRDET